MEVLLDGIAGRKQLRRRNRGVHQFVEIGGKHALDDRVGRRLRADGRAADGRGDVCADAIEREPGVETVEQRRTARRPLLHDHGMMRAPEIGELRLYVRKSLLECLDGGVEVLRPGAAEIGKERVLQPRIDKTAEHNRRSGEQELLFFS